MTIAFGTKEFKIESKHGISVIRFLLLISGWADTLPSGNADYVCPTDTNIIVFFIRFCQGKNVFFKQRFGLIQESESVSPC